MKLFTELLTYLFCGRFSHAIVKAVLEEVSEELLRDQEYDPENSTVLTKSVADEIQAKLQNGTCCFFTLLSIIKYDKLKSCCLVVLSVCPRNSTVLCFSRST